MELSSLESINKGIRKTPPSWGVNLELPSTVFSVESRCWFGMVGDAEMVHRCIEVHWIHSHVPSSTWDG